jgi:cytochrome d ubiquinol oxidase subunit II
MGRPSLLLLTIFSLSVWHFINPNALGYFSQNPLLIIFPLVYFSGLIGLFFVLESKNEMYPIIASSLVIVGGITSSLASMFPVILPSTNTVNESLTIYNTAAEKYGLSVALSWGVLGFILLFVYMIIQKRLMGGKMDYGH